MTIYRRFFTAVLLLLAIHTSAFADEPTPMIVAHRGLLQHAPANMLANFRACLELRLGFEFDVQRTKDGHLVYIHDDTVERTTNGTGKVADLTLEEIRRLDAGVAREPQPPWRQPGEARKPCSSKKRRSQAGSSPALECRTSTATSF